MSEKIKACRCEQAEALAEALKYIVNKANIARNVDESWKWINEFEEVAKQALSKLEESHG